VCGLLGCIFVTLKLVGIITWSWWWVTVPFWGLIAIVLFVLLIFAVILFCKNLSGDKKAKEKEAQS